MLNVKEMNVSELSTQLLSDMIIVDIRQKLHFLQESIPHSVHIDDTNFENFIYETDLDRPIVVVCYHGISSKHVATLFLDRGFETVYSLAGGYEAWKKNSNNKVV